MRNQNKGNGSLKIREDDRLEYAELPRTWQKIWGVSGGFKIKK